ncbi:MAG: S-layer homology domain-containing protein, partial [Defluviitaleaceae bacterium]|nr:S-layer homology domain-containing protein [Defluviitaleaceae bacterium]
MKKYLVAITVVVLLAFSAPAFAITNPFMDVPLNHWAYDAIGQLAARGIVSGFPDGTYKGRQPTTRYEMASVVARALALVDMTKASRHDVEMLKRLVVEFKDELDALGVRVNALDARVAPLHRRLGGWQISGALRTDIEFWDNDDADGAVNMARGRLFIDRWFGANEDMRFHLRLRSDHRGGGIVTEFQRFFVEFPWFFETRATVGRFSRDFEHGYYFMTGGVSDMQNMPWFGDGTYDGLALRRNFALGNFQMYLTRNSAAGTVEAGSRWEIGAWFNLQLTAQIGLDLGVFHLRADDATSGAALHANDFDSTTLWGGLRFDFNRDIQCRGAYYQESNSANSPGAHDENSIAYIL